MEDNFWGTTIRTLREQAGLTQRQLASITKINRAVIQRMEVGRGPINVQNLETILANLGYTLEALKDTEDGNPERAVLLASERRSRLAAARILTANLK